MRTPLLTVVALVALLLAPSAFGANTASISVTHDPFVLAGSSSTTIHVTIPQATDPIAAINIYVPAGYGASFSAAAGTTIGSVDATAFSHDAGLTLPLSGNVTADSPAAHTSDSTQCTGVATSAAVWILNLSVAGQTIALPLYVNPTAGVEQALGAYKLSICLPPPDVPIGTPGRSAQGAQVLDARFTVKGVLTTPANGGALTWTSLFTPYTPGKGTVNAAGTFYARGVVALPVSLAASQKKVGKKLQLSGTATQGSLPLAGASLRIAFGTSAKKLTKSVSATTSSTGSWKATLPAGSYFQVSTTVGETDFPAGCTLTPLPPTIAPGGCASTKLAPFSTKGAVTKGKK